MTTEQENDNLGLSFADRTKIEKALKIILGAPEDITRKNREAIGVYNLKNVHLGDIISDDKAFTIGEAFIKAGYVMRLVNEGAAQRRKGNDRKQRRVG